MVEADFDASAFVASAFVASGFVASGFEASDFIASEEEDPDGEEADGLLEPGLGLDGDGDCAMADDSINPLSAVVSNSFFNIGKTSMHVVFCGDALGHSFSFAAWKTGPLFTNV